MDDSAEIIKYLASIAALAHEESERLKKGDGFELYDTLAYIGSDLDHLLIITKED